MGSEDCGISDCGWVRVGCGMCGMRTREGVGDLVGIQYAGFRVWVWLW